MVKFAAIFCFVLLSQTCVHANQMGEIFSIFEDCAEESSLSMTEIKETLLTAPHKLMEKLPCYLNCLIPKFYALFSDTLEEIFPAIDPILSMVLSPEAMEAAENWIENCNEMMKNTDPNDCGSGKVVIGCAMSLKETVIKFFQA